MIHTILLIPSYLCYLLSRNNTLIEEDLAFWVKTLRINKGSRFRNFIWFMKNLKEYRTVFYWRLGKQKSKYIKWIAPAHPTLYIQVSPNNVGKGFVIQHGHSTIVLIKSCGDNCQIWQNVTLGKKQSGDKQPIPSIGNNVKICAGAIILGDVYVYPTRLDGIGLTLMEAIASGMACITINNGPMNEFIEDSFGKLCDVDYFYSRQDGYYWPMSVASIPSLAKQLDFFINNRNKLNKMKQDARAYALSNLDFVKNFNGLHDILSQVKLQAVPNELIASIQQYDYRKRNLLRYDKLRNYCLPLIKLRNLFFNH